MFVSHLFQMNFNAYLSKFQQAADKLNKKLLHEKQIEVVVGVVLDSVFLKLYKKSWASPAQDPVTAESRIFFSVWLNDPIVKKEKLFYNIHALKLRKLPGYKIESRKFAEAFRADFQDFKDQWQNVSTQFGPLTLMEGRLKVDAEDFQDNIIELANNFLAIEHLIEETLAKFKK
jgi:hypothetical protein